MVQSMLKPIKTFLNYLQRNANSSGIFGLTTPTTMNTSDDSTLDDTNDNLPTEEEFPDETERSILFSSDSQDPLYDPLALEECDDDDDDDEVTIANNNNTTTSKFSKNSDNNSNKIIVEKKSELNDSSNSEFIFVDVLTLKGSLANCNSDTKDLVDENEEEEEVGEEDEEDETTIIEVEEIYNETGIVETEIETETEAKVNRISDDSFTESAIVEEEFEELVTGEIEEPVSDGCDSGLGSEASRNESSIEKELIEYQPAKSSLKRKSQTEMTDEIINQKRLKKSIAFEGVTVYYFPRIQGFGCIPSTGGCTLGMDMQHGNSRQFSLTEHAAELRRQRRQQLQELNPPRSSSSEETDSEEEPSESGSEAESETFTFLQPITTRQRRAMLKAAGVKKIDTSEKDECRAIRTSREICGCTCRGYCDPDTCACSRSGIKCQVDRPGFPCGCSADGCGNVVGRVEFNPTRVRTHYIHTMMRLNIDNKQNEQSANYQWSPPVRLANMYPTEATNIHLQNQYSSYSETAPNSMTQTSNESLDLHYAFRDYYGTPSGTIPVQDYSNIQTYDYNNPYTQYHVHQHLHQQINYQETFANPVLGQPASQQRVLIEQEEDIVVEEDPGDLVAQLSMNNVQNGVNACKTDFIDLNTPLTANTDQLEAINDLLEHNRYRYADCAKENGLHYPAVVQAFDSDALCPQSDIVEENLCEIIKNSIVEAVSN